MIAARLTIRHRHASLASVAGELADVAPTEWLCPAELEVLSALRDSGRRAAWQSGRWLAKQLILATLSELGLAEDWRGTGLLNSEDICILSRDAQARGVHPLVLVHGKLMPWTLSISHSRQFVGAALALTADVRLGIDFTETAGITGRLAKVWFTDSEWSLLAGEDAQGSEQDLTNQLAVIWSVKEAAYKALNEGESFAPRQLEVRPLSSHRWLVTWNLGNMVRECQVQTELQAGSVRSMAAVNWTGISQTTGY